MSEEKERNPIIIGRNDGCDICDELGYICEDCIEQIEEETLC